MLTNFSQTESVICISAKSCHEYTFCVPKQITFFKTAASWVLGLSEKKHSFNDELQNQITSSLESVSRAVTNLCGGKEENKAKFSTVTFQRSLQMMTVQLKILEMFLL